MPRPIIYAGLKFKSPKMNIMLGTGIHTPKYRRTQDHIQSVKKDELGYHEMLACINRELFEAAMELDIKNLQSYAMGNGHKMTASSCGGLFVLFL